MIMKPVSVDQEAKKGQEQNTQALQLNSPAVNQVTLVTGNNGQIYNVNNGNFNNGNFNATVVNNTPFQPVVQPLPLVQPLPPVQSMYAFNQNSLNHGVLSQGMMGNVNQAAMKQAMFQSMYPSIYHPVQQAVPPQQVYLNVTGDAHVWNNNPFLQQQALYAAQWQAAMQQTAPNSFFPSNVVWNNYPSNFQFNTMNSKMALTTSRSPVSGYQSGSGSGYGAGAGSRSTTTYNMSSAEIEAYLKVHHVFREKLIVDLRSYGMRKHYKFGDASDKEFERHPCQVLSQTAEVGRSFFAFGDGLYRHESVAWHFHIPPTTNCVIGVQEAFTKKAQKTFDYAFNPLTLERYYPHYQPPKVPMEANVKDDEKEKENGARAQKPLSITMVLNTDGYQQNIRIMHNVGSQRKETVLFKGIRDTIYRLVVRITGNGEIKFFDVPWV